MSYASKLGHARINSRNPQAAAICDRCGFVYNHVDLQWQHDWAGASMINKRILVCHGCLDEPATQLRAFVVPPDPLPIMNPRVQDYVTAETSTRYTTAPPTMDARTGIPVPGGSPRGLENGGTRVGQQTGEPAPGINETPGVPYDNDSVPRTGNLK